MTELTPRQENLLKLMTSERLKDKSTIRIMCPAQLVADIEHDIKYLKTFNEITKEIVVVAATDEELKQQEFLSMTRKQQMDYIAGEIASSRMMNNLKRFLPGYSEPVYNPSIDQGTIDKIKAEKRAKREANFNKLHGKK